MSNLDKKAIKRIITESVNKVLTESMASRSQHQARQFCRQNGIDNPEAFINSLRNNIPSLRIKGQKEFFSNDGGKFTFGCARIVLECGYKLTFLVSKKLNLIVRKLINSNEYNNYDSNFNGLNLQELSRQVNVKDLEKSDEEKNIRNFKENFEGLPDNIKINYLKSQGITDYDKYMN